MEQSSGLKRHLIFFGTIVALAMIVSGYWLLLPRMQALNFVLPNELRDFITLTLSIIVEATPFIILGALVSAAVRVFVSADFIIRHMPRHGFLRRVLLSFLGAFLPVCECGNVPVARSLIQKGFTTADSITFLLAAPIINPITIFSTWTAFQFDPVVIWVRVIAGFVIANIVGGIFALYGNQSDLLNGEFRQACETSLEHEHTGRWQEFLRFFRNETILLLRMLCFGAVIAGLTQVFISREALIQVGGNPILSILAMIGLAFIVSICSTVDAFFALAYTSTFTMGAITSFLVFGPMINIKMLALMKTTYRTHVLAIMLVLIVLLSAITGLMVNYVF